MSGPARAAGEREEGAENRICLMFRGSGPGHIQKSNSEHFRRTEYCKIQRMEAKSPPEVDRNASGPARAAGGRNSDFIRGLQNSADEG